MSQRRVDAVTAPSGSHTPAHAMDREDDGWRQAALRLLSGCGVDARTRGVGRRRQRDAHCAALLLVRAALWTSVEFWYRRAVEEKGKRHAVAMAGDSARGVLRVAPHSVALVAPCKLSVECLLERATTIFLIPKMW